MMENAGNHLWQSTVCVLLAAVLVRLVGARHPRLSHRLWLAASLKFLVPFSLLFSVGQSLGPRLLPAVRLPALPEGLEAVGQPFSTVFFRTQAIVPGADAVAFASIAAALAMIWLTGALLVLLLRIVQWGRTLALARRSPALDAGRELEALRRVARRVPCRRLPTIHASSSLLEPAVVGLVRPALIWPADLSPHLSDAQMDAILVHELAHVRRRDNLTALLHTCVETIFWFHPIVWWVGARLVDAREHACDQDVLRSGAQPRAYAEGLLHVCRFTLRMPGRLAAGIASSNLSQRVEAIMTYRSEPQLGAGIRLVVGAVTALVLVGPVAAGTLEARAEAANSAATPTQDGQPRPEVDPVPMPSSAPMPVPVSAVPGIRSVTPVTVPVAVPSPSGPRTAPAPTGPAVPALERAAPGPATAATQPVAVAVTPARAPAPAPAPAARAPAATAPAAPRPAGGVPQPARVAGPSVATSVLAPAAVPVQPVAAPAQAQPRDPVPPPSLTEEERIAEFRRGALPTSTPGLMLPRVQRDVRPNYTSEAMRQKVQGTVEVEVIVGTDGTVTRARITRSLDSILGLDDSALQAARQWTFRPAQLNGEPVAVWSTLVLDFRLH
jgi:TonB family protein